MKVLFLLLIFSMLAASCAEEKTIEPVAPAGIIDSSLSFFDGEVLLSAYSNVNEMDVWEVQIENANKSLVTIRWRIKPLKVFDFEGTRGPFDYDLSPGNNLINFSTARTIAMGQVNQANILHWILKQNNSDNELWVYAFEFENIAAMSATVYVDAANGNILEVQ